MMFEHLLTAKEAAAYLKLTVDALARYRWLGNGPPFVRLNGGRAIRYRKSDLDKWLEANTVKA